ncbi:unnamed protein product [Trichogramma brassicae]|uniref:Uncharacterized protein n=1 Tax=Trichogramma brassicae TaxID=86971 RepID=A0A6H5J3P2_9HYME|nr:unnamed protein product [Trichogramma brassicae]
MATWPSSGEPRRPGCNRTGAHVYSAHAYKQRRRCITTAAATTTRDDVFFIRAQGAPARRATQGAKRKEKRNKCYIVDRLVSAKCSSLHGRPPLIRQESRGSPRETEKEEREREKVTQNEFLAKLQDVRRCEQAALPSANAARSVRQYIASRYIFTPNTGCGSGGGGGDATAATLYTVRWSGEHRRKLSYRLSEFRRASNTTIRGYRQGSSCGLQSFFGPLAYVAVQLVSLPARCVCSLTIRTIYMPSSSRPLYTTQSLEGYCTRVILEFDVCRFLVPASRLSAV